MTSRPEYLSDRRHVRQPLPLTVVAVALICVGACTIGDASHSVLLSHSFETSADGWSITTDTGSREPVFRAAGGDPGGFIAGDDEALGETWYFSAPASVLSSLPAAIDGRLSFSLKQSSDVPGYLDDDIVIVGPAGRLSYRFDSAPATTWTRFSVALSADAGWQWNWNAPATAEQMRSVLGDATRLEIRGEYQTGPDDGGLDTFDLHPAR